MGCKQSHHRGGQPVRFSEPVDITDIVSEPQQASAGHVEAPSVAPQSEGESRPDREPRREVLARERRPAAPPASAPSASELHLPAAVGSSPDSARQNRSSLSTVHAVGGVPVRFRSVGPSRTDGELVACFKDGLLYRIVTAEGSWLFYNDTQDYEMHVAFTFGPGSDVLVIPPATSQRGSEEDLQGLVVSVVVYPGETVPFIEGRYNGYRSNISARQLSSEYRQRINAEANLKVAKELNTIRTLSRGSLDVERIVASCVNQGVPFVDPTFPPLSTSLSRAGVDSRSLLETAWRRPRDYLPKELHPHIALFRNGVDPNDIDQGQLGDCWLLCAIASVAEFPSKVESMFAHPVSQEQAEREALIGAYRVVILKHGWWRVVIVDDYFPVVGQKPCFAKCLEDACELWVSLLEKAYAKYHGSYAAITGGDSLQALQDITGFPVYRFDDAWQLAATRGNAEAFFSKLLTYDGKSFLITLNTPGYDTAAYAYAVSTQTQQGSGGDSNSKTVEERYKRAGLTLGHSYTVLRVYYNARHDLRLLQIRNPWGTGFEWTGRWGDGDSAWRQFPDVASEVGFVAAEDGAFWMAYDDALKYFDGGGVCFTQFDWHDYRVRGRFQNGYPNVVLEVHVTQPVTAYVTLSQKDKRGLPTNDPDATYSALMLSVSRQFNTTGGAAGNIPAAATSMLPSTAAQVTRQKVHLNSTANTEEPSEQFTFNYSRDLGMAYEFRPESAPYYVIPRIYDAGGTKDYVLGLLSDTGIAAPHLQVRFKALPKTCRVFHNFPVFSTDGVVDVDSEFQHRPEVGAPRSSHGTSFAAL